MREHRKHGECHGLDILKESHKEIHTLREHGEFHALDSLCCLSKFTRVLCIQYMY